MNQSSILAGRVLMHRLRAGLLAVSIAAVTTVSVTITAQPASADVLTPQEIKVVQGVVKAAGPRVAARAVAGGAVCAGTLGVGCAALAVVGIAGLAYDTKDIWMPWVKGNLENGGSTTTPYSGPLIPSIDMQLGVMPDELPSGSNWNQLTIVGTGIYRQGGDARGAATIEIVCKSGEVRTYGLAWTYYSWDPNVQTHGFAGLSGHQGCGGLFRTQDIASITLTPAANQWGTIASTLTWQGSLTVTEAVTELTCRRPDGTTYTRSLSTVNPGTQVGVSHCDPGDTPVRVKGSAATGNGALIPQWDIPLGNDSIHDQEYPQCAGAACGYRIRVDGNPCVEGVEKCTHWSYIWSKQAYRVECFYGPYSIAVDQCLFLERAYDLATGARTITDVNTDGNPDTYTAPAPTPVRTTTITPTPTSTSTSSASPSVTPTPIEVGTPKPDPPADPAGARCFPQGWGVFNPFAWVYMPIMCAMRDAFVPDTALTVDRIGSIRTKLETKGPGPAITQVSTVIGSVPSGGGCQGPPMTINLAGTSHTLYLFSACAPPMSTAAGYSHALATVVLVVGGTLSVVRALAGAFGLSFSMGKGASDGD